MKLSLRFSNTQVDTRGRWPVVLLALLLTLLASVDATAAERDPFQGDARLQKSLAVRVSRTPVGELLQRIGDTAGCD
jgi:hypothetical protein